MTNKDNIKPEKIGNKYTLGNQIGKGGYGTCYEATDEENNKFAIKKIKMTLDANVEEVKNEIKILNDLKCMTKHSVNFIESIPEQNKIKLNDDVYIVMELCNTHLTGLLEKKNGNLDIVTIIKIINQLNEVFKIMHLNKFEHRDLKPENILIKYINDDDFEIKLTDYRC